MKSMNKININPYKGSRDFYPDDKRFQKWMFDAWRGVIESFGYEEYDAPILEPTDLFLMKGSEEIVKEQTYTFQDRGDRSVTIRTEMTPSVSRMIAGKRQELAYPVRWYSIPNIWRYERMQRGRLREFWQLNVDIFGVESVDAEIEMLQIVDAIFQKFNAKRSSYVLYVNSRVLVNILLVERCGLDATQTEAMIRLIDRMKKLSPNDFATAVNEISQDKEVAKKLIEVLKIKMITELPKDLQQLPSVQNLTKVIESLQAQGIRNVQFDISLMRGFDYYTDIVFEVNDTNPENNRSMFGGGRYDGLVGQFGVDPVPTVGFGMGDVTFKDFLETNKLIPDLASDIEVRLLLRDDISSAEAQKPAQELREMGVNVAVDFSGRKFDKQFKAATKSGVRYIVIAGKEELQNNQFILKDLKSGKEQKHSLQRIVSIVKDARKK